jgi:hypothetical protein
MPARSNGDVLYKRIGAYMITVRAVLVCLLSAFFMESSHGQDTLGPTRGTLITAMGNKQGIVVMTDSRASVPDATGHFIPDPRHPLQKLIKYDKQMVCAAAGLWRMPARKKSEPQKKILPGLDIQALGIVQTYRDLILASGVHQSMSETLAGLSAAIRGRFDIQADLNDYLGHSSEEITNIYRLQLILAGIDTDGEPKIGRIEIGVSRERRFDGQLHWTAHEIGPRDEEGLPRDCRGLTTVKDELVICSAGIDGIEKKMRAHPAQFTQASIMQDFISARDGDHGASLSLEYLKKLGHLFKVETGYADEKVGGTDQIAAIRKDSDVEVDLPGNLDRIKNQAPFTVWICKPGPGVYIKGMAAGVGIVSDIPIIFESCTFITMDLILDGNVYMHCTFRDSQLSYWGGDNTLFEDDNTVEGNSFLRGGPSSCRHPDVMEQLAKRFDFEHGGTAYNGPGGKLQACPSFAPPATPSTH